MDKRRNQYSPVQLHVITKSAHPPAFTFTPPHQSSTLVCAFPMRFLLHILALILSAHAFTLSFPLLSLRVPSVLPRQLNPPHLLPHKYSQRLRRHRLPPLFASLSKPPTPPSSSASLPLLPQTAAVFGFYLLNIFYLSKKAIAMPLEVMNCRCEQCECREAMS